MEKIQFSYYIMKDQHMLFQDSSMHSSKDVGRYKQSDGSGRKYKPKAICPHNLFKVGRHNKMQ